MHPTAKLTSHRRDNTRTQSTPKAPLQAHVQRPHKNKEGLGLSSHTSHVHFWTEERVLLLLEQDLYFLQAGNPRRQQAAVRNSAHPLPSTDPPQREGPAQRTGRVLQRPAWCTHNRGPQVPSEHRAEGSAGQEPHTRPTNSPSFELPAQGAGCAQAFPGHSHNPSPDTGQGPASNTKAQPQHPRCFLLLRLTGHIQQSNAKN